MATTLCPKSSIGKQSFRIACAFERLLSCGAIPFTFPTHTTPVTFDFHTHILSSPPGSAIVCLPQEALRFPDRWLTGGHLPHAPEGALYAAGIHPWWLAQPGFSLGDHLAGLRLLLQQPEVVQLGECGFDTLQGDGPDRSAAPLHVQEEAFVAQVELSEALGRPLTIHCVRAYDRLLRLAKELRPSQRWTLHGFRGRPALARQLLAAGFDLSFGPRRNEEAYALTPPDRRHDETDATPEA